MMAIRSSLSFSLVLCLSLLLVAAFPGTAANTCPTLIQGDMDGDGDCDYDDLLLFEQALDAGDPSADWNYDCFVNDKDYIPFIDMLVAGGVPIMDFNRDRVINILDVRDFYNAWLDGFNGGSTVANVTQRYAGQGDCVVNIVDLDCWLDWYNNCQ